MAEHLDDPRPDVEVVRRPWGEFCQFSTARPVTVKVLTVDPGHRLSLQRHELRGEMWQLLDEPLAITVGDETWAAQAGELLWIAPGVTHRITNEGERPGRILEVAFGTFDEDDIERLSDDYDRS